MARARAAAEWAEEAAASVTTPMQRVTATAPIKTDDWKTEPLNEAWDTSPPSQVERIIRIARPVATLPAKPFTRPLPLPPPQDAPKSTPAITPQARFVQAATAPGVTPASTPRIPAVTKPALAAGSGPARTVIPVPALPQVTDPTLVRPVISPRAPVVAQPPKRYPRATGRVEDTIRTHAVPPANDDRTSPSIALPPASTAKRVASKQR